MRTIDELRQLQALPLGLKVKLTKQRIREWVNHYGTDGVYVSFSGGKDSTVLLDIVREEYPNVPALFVDVPTQYPELKEFVKTFDNVDIVAPKISFAQVCEKYGFPLIGKEVAECVYGAKKYLTKFMDSASLDRPTDRPTDRIGTALELGGKTKGWRYFAKITGTITNGGTINPKLYKGNRQRKSSDAFGDLSEFRQSEDGEYP